MAAMSVTRLAHGLRWQAQRWARHTWAGPALLVLALVAALAAALWWWSAGERLQAERGTRQAASAAVALPHDKPSSAGLELQLFIDSLPLASDATATVQRLLDLAQQQNLRLLRGSYQLQPEPAARFARFRMSLPVRGSPAEVQRFIRSSLVAIPALAIDSIQFKRVDEKGQLLEARVQWVLFVRTGRVALTAPAPAAALGVSTGGQGS
jgi:hypothetical protein